MDTFHQARATINITIVIQNGSGISVSKTGEVDLDENSNHQKERESEETNSPISVIDNPANDSKDTEGYTSAKVALDEPFGEFVTSREGSILSLPDQTKTEAEKES